MSTVFVQKSDAIAEISQKTGFGKYVIDKKINELTISGIIKIVDDPADRRRQLLRREDIQVIIDALTPR